MSIVDDPERLNQDTETARLAFERFLLAPYSAEVTPECDSEIGDGCHNPAEWIFGCNACTEVILLCGPDFNTLAVASRQFGIATRCHACGSIGLVDSAFTFELLRSPK